MRLVTFTVGEGARLGALQGGRVIDLAEASGGRLPGDMLAFLQQGEAAMELAREAVQGAGSGVLLSEVTLLAPVPSPPKVVGIGLNYMDHCLENDLEPPERPVIFAKFSTAVIGPGEAIRWSPALTRKVDYEVELAVVIGKTARAVDPANALDFVAGYMVMNDVTARDIQKGEKQWFRGKSFDTFAPCGPWLTSPADAGDVYQHTRLSVFAPQLDQQVGAASDDAGLGAVLGQET